MPILDYFSLESNSPEPTLGKKTSAKALRNTMTMYIGVFLGVLGKYIFSLYVPGQRLDATLLDPFWVLISLVIAAVIFPQIYKGAKLRIQTADPMQFFIAFQNGFFWQSILEIISKSLTG